MKLRGYVLCAICWSAGAICWAIGSDAAMNSCAACAFALGGLLLAIHSRRDAREQRGAPSGLGSLLRGGQSSGCAERAAAPSEGCEDGTPCGTRRAGPNA